MDERDNPLRFRLRRNKDADIVADGVQFADGTVVIRWRGDHPSTQTYEDWGHAMRVHHIGEPNSGKQWTTAEWLDGVCFACSNRVEDFGRCYGNQTFCHACAHGWEGPPNRYVGEHPTTWKSIELPTADAHRGDG